MNATDIHLNGCYRMKPDVFRSTVQASGEPHLSPDVTIVRIKFPVGRKRAWYFDAAGNAYRADDFSGVAEVIPVEV